MIARILISGLLAALAGTAATECTASKTCAICATALFLKALRQVVDSTVGDVVQLVRALPCHAGPAFEFRGSRHSFAALARSWLSGAGTETNNDRNYFPPASSAD